MADRKRRVLFVQAADAAFYPPVIHAAKLMADMGWDVTVLSAPVRGNSLQMPSHANIDVVYVRARPSHVMHIANYARYCLATARLALRRRPHVVYASDPLGAGPGLIASTLARATLVYHEHDSPAPGSLRPLLYRLRNAAARAARLVVFPNEARAKSAQAELGFKQDRLHIVWNLPERSELPALTPIAEDPLLLYYHGSITPERLPEAVVDGLRRFGGRVRLRVIGYEAPSAAGYVQRLVERGRAMDGTSLVEYAGQVTRANLLSQATGHHVGLALVPTDPRDPNLKHMSGASNKPFDYMAAGLALLVSDLPDWHEMFVAPGFARSCDARDAESIHTTLRWFLDHPAERRAMAARARDKIAAQWNYNAAFAPVLRGLSGRDCQLVAEPVDDA